MGNQKIHVIGSGSFLASNLIPLLRKNEKNIVHFGRKNTAQNNELFHLFQHPNSPLDLSILLQADVIIYAASLGVQSGDNSPSEWIHEVNTNIPSNIFTFLQKNNFKGSIFTFGSYFEIGNNANEISFDESDIISSSLPAANIYTESKRNLTRFIHQNTFDFTHYHLILPTIYGENENKNRLIPYLVNGLQAKQKITLTQGTQIRQYLYVEDLCHLIAQTIEKPIPSGIYNVSPFETIKVRDLVNKIVNLLNASSNSIEFNSIERQDLSMKALLLNCHKLEKACSWQPKYSLEEIIHKYVSSKQ
ncbi:MAG: NAD-dependent epimerase/dehydratase family protein [Flavobacteriales bacterium]